MTDLERDLLAACRAQHDAIDTLFAMLIVRDRSFRPTQSGRVWEALEMGNAAIQMAEARHPVEASQGQTEV
jgi:hypothetical protein